MKVQAGYDAMIHLFTYLSPADLLRLVNSSLVIGAQETFSGIYSTAPDQE
jgi:hypothetical protein